MDGRGSEAARPRNAAATRAGILRSARELFARVGYEHAGVREIATLAGVNAALVIRYFGSKEELFAEAMASGFGVANLIAGERFAFGERLARYLFQKAELGGSFDPMLALLRSAPDPQAAAVLRRSLGDQFIGPLAAWIGGPDGEVRATLIAAYLTGLSVIREVLQDEALQRAETEALVALVAPVVQRYVDGAGPANPES